MIIVARGVAARAALLATPDAGGPGRRSAQTALICKASEPRFIAIPAIGAVVNVTPERLRWRGAKRACEARSTLTMVELDDED